MSNDKVEATGYEPPEKPAAETQIVVVQPMNQVEAEKVARLIDWTKAKAYAAALAAALVVGLAVLFTALEDDHVSSQEWVGFLIAFLGAPSIVGSTVYRVPNKPKPKKMEENK